MTPDAKLAVAHTNRFRRVSNRYPRRVNEAYGFDQARALADDDATVAATVEAWERAQGLAPRDWVAIGRDEGTIWLLGGGREGS
jgi:predicted esterase